MVNQLARTLLQVTRQLGKLRLVLILSRTNLYHWSKTANLDEYWLSCLWIISEIALAGFVLIAGFQAFLHFRLKALVEILHPVGPFGLSFCNIIKLLLYVCRKVVVHDVREVLPELEHFSEIKEALGAGIDYYEIKLVHDLMEGE